MTKMKAVLFDCDGLMFNTEQISQDMWREEARKYGEKLSDTFFQNITGAKKGVDISAFLNETPHLNEISLVMRKKRFNLSFWSSFPKDTLNKKGLVELVHFLEEKHIHRAVCSSSEKEYVSTLLHSVSVPLSFDCIIGGDSIVHGKPDPEIFLKASNLLGVLPEECLVLEDSKQGILAAHRANMHSVFIQDTIIPDEEMEQVLDYRCDSLCEVIELLGRI